MTDHNAVGAMVASLFALPHTPIGEQPSAEPDADFNWLADGRAYRLRLWPVTGGVVAMAESAEPGQPWPGGPCIRVDGRDAVRITKEISAAIG